MASASRTLSTNCVFLLFVVARPSYSCRMGTSWKKVGGAGRPTYGDDLVEAIYDSAVDPATLEQVVTQIRDQMRATAAVNFTFGPSGPRLWYSTGIDPQAFRDYASYYHHVDVFMQATVAQGLLRTGAVLCDDQIVDPETMRRSPFVNELLRPNGLGPRCGSTLYVERRGCVVQLSFYRRPGAERFDTRSVDLVRRLAPHLGRAARLRMRFGAAGSPPLWTHELLDGLPWGIVLLDALARPVFVNAEATHILQRADGFGLSRRGPYAAHPSDAARLRRLVARALSGEPGGGRLGGDLAVQRPSGAPALLLTVVPLGASSWQDLGGGVPRAALHLIDPMRQPRDEAGRLAALFGLSPAEQRLALGLVAELTLKDIADLYGVSPSTVKTQLESLFAKTGKSRQSSLVRLLHQTLALPRTRQG